MNIVTGCSGIDAIAYAATLLDIEVKGQIEIDEFCNRILELRYPEAKRYKNIFDVKGDEFGTVDIFAFGDPCQPHSVAGKQKGTADDRYIWPEIFRIIKTMRPPWIINENVVGSVSNGVVREKILQLENEKYRARAFTIPACAVGAPHERQRVFIVGHSKCGGCGRHPRGRAEQEPQDGYSRVKAMAHTESKFEGRLSEREGEKDARFTVIGEDVANASGTRQQECNSSRKSEGKRYGSGSSNETGATRAAQSKLGRNVDGTSDRIYRPGGQEDSGRVLAAFETIFIATLEQILWPAGYGAEQYGYEPPRVATGIKNRTNRLKALGNSIVWQTIFPVLLAIKIITLNHSNLTPKEEGG